MGFWTGTADREAQGELVEQLGTALLRTEVAPSAASRSLVCSTRGLGAHTDHFRADFIVWECHRQAEQGGETFVVDPMPAFESLSERDQVAVRSTEMHEHRVFADDPQTRPIFHDVPGSTRFYFTYWLSRVVTREQEAAVRKFRDGLDASPRLFSARLAPGELLVVDNRRLLHGREAFSGARHLVRTWVSEDDSWKPRWLPRDGGRS